MVVNNPNNWHWVDKNCLPWSKTYFDEKLVKLSAQNDDSKVTITEVSSVEGDVDVSQRKGKVISLFDVRLVLVFQGSTAEDNSVLGSITIPELTYDTEEDELVFNITVYNETSKNYPIVDLIKKKLVPQLRQILSQFGPDLIETNSRDIQIEADKVTSTFTKASQTQAAEKKAQETKQAESTKNNETTKLETKATSETKKPKEAPSSSSSSSYSSSDVAHAPKYNTTTLHLEPEFNTSAEQIYRTLLDEPRIAAWTRSYPIIDAFPPKEGSEFKFFSGSVQGKILKLVPNEQIVQLWRLDDWKAGHYAELNMKLIQGSGETKLVTRFTGIPIGEEERVKDNFEEMYIRSIKITFGFGAVL